MNPPVGLDFGTTNSSVARVQPDGTVALVSFPTAQGFTESFRSLLYLERATARGPSTVRSWAGPEGIERYLQAEVKGRLVQSLKSFLSSRLLVSTDVFGRQYTVEDLIARMLRELRQHAERAFGHPVRHAVVGRPVHYVGAEQPADNDHAVNRMHKALQLAGWEHVRFELEPIGAAYHYESTLDHDELILIGDFGGGTSDFSLLRVGPTIRTRGRQPQDLLGNAGLGLAGDAFDARIIKHLVSPQLGAGSSIRSLGKELPMPVWVYSKLERWHHLSLLKNRETLEMLRSIAVQSESPDQIDALLHLIREDLGYQLHRAVQAFKCRLSESEQATFHFADAHVEIEASIPRADFEDWIEPELDSLDHCIAGLLSDAGVDARDVDRVFLTGGTSFVPAVRRLFAHRFGADRIRTGGEFTSVARGLALSAL